MGFLGRSHRRKLLLLALLICCVFLFIAFYSSTGPISSNMWPRGVIFVQPEFEETEQTTMATTSQESFLIKAPELPNDPMDILKIQIPNLPVEFLLKNKNKSRFKRNNCARLPSMLAIELNNYYWQSLSTPNSTFQFFNAYYDNRTEGDPPSVRVISMVTNKEPESVYCQFWFENDKSPMISKIKSFHYIWRKAWGTGAEHSYQPYLITCQLPKKYPHVPVALSIVANECDNATNLLKVNNEKVDTKKDFAVCVKGLDFPDVDISVRLVEWVELLSLLGNDKVFFYNLQVHPNVTKLLNYYQMINKAQVIQMTLAGTQPNHPILQHQFLKENILKKRHNEVITFNDCFYRNMNLYRYVAVLDIDEVIMPVGNLTSWSQLIEAVVEKEKIETKKVHASFFARNIYFLDNHMHEHSWFEDIPKHLHMMQHVYRSANFTGPKEYVKTFFNTDLTLLVHNHLPFACFGSYCSYAIPTDLAQMQHYRTGCERSVKKVICEDMMVNSVLDTNIWRFKKELIERSNKVLKIIGYDAASSEYVSG